jgi:hypothetical protein
MKNLYFIEITDTFGGEANYSWVTRHCIRAKSQRGAINALSRRSGMNWHSVGCDRYDSASGATCCFVLDYDPEFHSKYRFNSDDRT